MTSFQDLFFLGMKRDLRILLAGGRTKVVNIGSSAKDKCKIPNADMLGLPSWSFPRDPLPYDNESVTLIHCYHFLEHLTGSDAISFLREVERVLIPTGVFNFCMPYYNSNLQAECLDHKSQWNENSFRNLFHNSGYNISGDWALDEHFLLIAGVKEDNLCIIGQLVKGHTI